MLRRVHVQWHWMSDLLIVWNHAVHGSKIVRLASGEEEKLIEECECLRGWLVDASNNDQLRVC